MDNLRPIAPEHLVTWLAHDKPNSLHTLVVADDSRVVLVVLGPPQDVFAELNLHVLLLSEETGTGMREGKLLPALGELDLEMFNAKRHAQELDLVLRVTLLQWGGLL